MITYTIAGPKADIEKAGSKLRSMLQTEGHIVAYFPQGMHADAAPNPAVTVTIVCKPE